VGSKGRFRYVDARGNQITDPAKLARIESLVIPPAWRDVWISPRPQANLQATGVDNAGRRQYLYHPEFRARQEQAKYDKLVRFAERLPELRAAMGEHMALDPLHPDRVSAIAVRLINLTWFRVGSERHTRRSHTYGLTTLTKRHVRVRGKRVAFSFQAKHGARVRTAIVDPEIAAGISHLLRLPGRRVFRYELDGELRNLTGRKLNEYIQRHMGEEFTAKDFRTWGGTLEAAIAFAELGDPPDGVTAQRRAVARVMRRVGERLGNTPTVARTSYVSPAVVEQYLDGRTIDDFRPRHLRVVGARDSGLDVEEQAVLSLLRSARIRRARAAA
jgi:DNA topoisomerase IB